MKSNDEKLTARSWFYSQPKQNVPECSECDALKVYRLGYTGQYIIETEIDSGLGGEPVEINQITDIHFNYVAIADESDGEAMGTRSCRKWLREGESVKSAINAMNVAEYADQTVITGDTLDYLSKGTEMLTKRHIISRDPGVMIALGGHDLTKQMQTSLPNELSLDERMAILSEFWPHDMFYHAKDVGDKVICVCLDNSRSCFLPCQPDRLDKEIKRARTERKILLLFMHEPISTRDFKGKLPTLWYSPGAHREYDFCTEDTVGFKPNDEATKRMYSLITENADVIKGIFCGHRHSMFYTEIIASYSDNEGIHQSVIPQLVAPGNPYLDHAGRVVRIIVK
ncbi:MAG: metallophosphoesterase [Clostridia bacterium]|nr:metallophosphoesterase [Clostridia bacterium]